MTDQEIIVAPPVELPEDQEIPLPGGFRKKDRCPSCKSLNLVQEVVIKENGIECHFHCDCGTNHGIVHTGGYVQAYHAFTEGLKKLEKHVLDVA